MDPAERDRWRHELAATGAWVRRTPPARMVLPGLGCLGFTAVGVALVATGTAVGWVVGGLAVAVFGLWFLPVVVWRAVTGKPVLRVDHGGLVVGRVAVPWAETAGWASSGGAAAAPSWSGSTRPGWPAATPRSTWSTG